MSSRHHTTGSYRRPTMSRTGTRGEASRTRTSGKHRNRRRKSTSIPQLNISGRVLLRIILGLLFIGAVVAGAHSALGVLAGSGRLAVRALHIDGLQRATTAEVRVYAGVREGQSMLDIDVDQAAEALSTHPWIKQARVGRNLEGVFTISVVEYEPRMIVLLDASYLADGEGVLFKQVARGDGVDLPVLTGLTRDDFGSVRRPSRKQDDSYGGRITAEAVALSEAYGQSPELKGTLRYALEGLHFDRVLGWSLLLRQPEEDKEATLTVHLGRDAVARLPLMDSAIAHVAHLRGGASARAPLAELWLDHPTHKERIQWRRAPRVAGHTAWPRQAEHTRGKSLNIMNPNTVRTSQEEPHLVAKAETHGSE